MKPRIIDVHSISGQQQAFEVEYPEGMSKVYFVTSTGISHHPNKEHIDMTLKYHVGFDGFLEIESQALNTLDMLLQCDGLEPWMCEQLLYKSKTWGMIVSIRDNPINVLPAKIVKKEHEQTEKEIELRKIKKIILDNSFCINLHNKIEHLIDFDFKKINNKHNQFGYVKRKHRY